MTNEIDRPNNEVIQSYLLRQHQRFQLDLILISRSRDGDWVLNVNGDGGIVVVYL